MFTPGKILLILIGIAALFGIGAVGFRVFPFLKPADLPSEILKDEASLTTRTPELPSSSVALPTSAPPVSSPVQTPAPPAAPRVPMDTTRRTAPAPPLPRILAEPPVPPTSTAPLSFSSSTLAAAATSTLVAVAPSPVALDPQSIVGLSCFFKNQATNALVNFAKGSGVIIDPRGYILTSRHLVDLAYAAAFDGRFAAAADTYLFNYCAVGSVNRGATLPAPELIEAFNPSIQLPVLGYAANLFYLPKNLPVSSEEAEQLDFAILKIYGLSADGPSFGVTVLPAAFPFAPLALREELPAVGDRVLTYGYPGDVTAGMLAEFNTLYLAGGVGQVVEILGGNDYFVNRPLVINTRMGVSSGRSGSPLIAKGRVAGIISFYREGNSADSFSVAATAIREFLPEVLRFSP